MEDLLKYWKVVINPLLKCLVWVLLICGVFSLVSQILSFLFSMIKPL